MSFDFINLVISGRLTRDPEIKKIDNPNGQLNIMRFTIANNFKRRENEANYFDCEFWFRDISNYFYDRLKKGTFVVLNGYLRHDRWTSKIDQTQKNRIIIVVTNILSLVTKDNNRVNDGFEKKDVKNGISEKILDSTKVNNFSDNYDNIDHNIEEFSDYGGEDPEFENYNSFDEPNNFS
ncbi:MAG: single-stranded DNA-binding protein [Spirochaetes bacterium]|nr:single-stranded DNA-binding protein [Spirochaetota bacterium]